MVNIAFAGLRHGHIFALYGEAVKNPEYTVVGAFEENEAARAEAEARGLSCNYKSLDELLADERVDVVALGGRYGERGGYAVRALRAGKHVIADKPLATSVEQLEEIEKAALALGMIPQEQAQQIVISVDMPQTEEKIGFWAHTITFLEGLFA
jgi:predicted dehydrogenase